MAEKTPAAEPGTRSPWGWRRAMIIAFCLTLGLAAGAAYYRQTPKTYQASATVLVLPTTTGLDSGSPGGSSEINMETEAELARSTSVASVAVASDALDGNLTTSELISKGSITVPENSQVIQLTAQAPTPVLARDAANAWATAYLERRSEQAANLSGGAAERLQRELDDAESDLNALPDRAGDPDVQAKRDVLIDSISGIKRQLVILGVGPTESGQIITEATLPVKPAAPQLPLSLGAGLFAGAALAVGFVLLGAMRSARAAAASPKRATEERQVRVLASVSSATSGSSPVETEDLRRTSRDIATRVGDPGPVVLLGCGDPGMATRVALQLGMAWASEFGASVVVSTDSTALDVLPRELRGRPGLTDLLVNAASPSDCATPLPGSRALAIGPGQQITATDQSGSRLMEVWSRLDHEFGTVLASSNQHDSPIGSRTLRTAGRVVGIVRAGRDSDRDLAALLDALDDQAAADRLVGVILVDDGDIRRFGVGGASMDDGLGADEFAVVEHGDTDSFESETVDDPRSAKLWSRG